MVVICPRCGKETTPVRKVGWRWFALWLLLGMIPALIWRWFALWLLLGMLPALIYVFYHFTKVPKNCPICGYRNVYDEGQQLEEERVASLRRQPQEKGKIANLKRRLLYLDRALKKPNKLSQQTREELTREIHEVAEELRKYGYKGVVQKVSPISLGMQKIKDILLKERKY